jgi:hypothetical protein
MLNVQKNLRSFCRVADYLFSPGNYESAFLNRSGAIQSARADWGTVAVRMSLLNDLYHSACGDEAKSSLGFKAIQFSKSKLTNDNYLRPEDRAYAFVLAMSMYPEGERWGETLSFGLQREFIKLEHMLPLIDKAPQEFRNTIFTRIAEQTSEVNLVAALDGNKISRKNLFSLLLGKPSLVTCLNTETLEGFYEDLSPELQAVGSIPQRDGLLRAMNEELSRRDIEETAANLVRIGWDIATIADTTEGMVVQIVKTAYGVSGGLENFRIA